MPTMRKRITVIATVLALGAAACGSTAEDPEVALEQPSPTTSDGEAVVGTAPPGEDRAKGGDKGKPEDDKSGRPKDGSAGSEDGGGGEDPHGTAPPDGSPPEGGGAPGGRDDETGGSAPRGGSGGAPLAPAAGDYVYTQSGFEEFCAGGGCDRQSLPKRQVVDTSVQRSGSSATVVTEMRASRSRVSRTTTRYTRGAASVSEVYARFTYAGYTFEQTYRPNPPVELLRFPLTSGASWSGSWKGRVSGSYSVSVAGRERVRAAGRVVEAVRVETTTRFRGEFEGRANGTLWIDPRTKALVKTAGNLNVKSTYGSYATGFATALASGPGY